MPTDRSLSAYPAFLIPDPAFLFSNLADDSSYTAVGPIPGAPTPAGSYKFALASHGEQGAGGDLTITTQSGGVVGRTGASFLWKNSGDANPWLGWDAPTVLTGWQSLVWAASPDVGQPCVLSLASGSGLAVWAEGSTLTHVYGSLNGDTPAEITLAGGALGAAGCAPCLVQLPPSAEIPLGRLLLFVWVRDSATSTMTIQMQFSDDDGATWSSGASGVLPETVSADATTGYYPTRLRGAYANGQILLIAGLQYNDTSVYPASGTPADQGYRNEVRQYASSDAGHNFTEVWSSDLYKIGTDSWWEDPNSQDGGGYPDVVVFGETFYVAWLSLIDAFPYVFRLESAYQSLGTTRGVKATTSEAWGGLDVNSSYFDEGDCVFVVDEVGVLYITGRTVSSGNRWVVNQSLDFGATWGAMARSSLAGGGGVWWDAEDSGTYPDDAAGCWHKGRLLIVAGHQSNPSTYDGGSMSVYALGGYTSITMPGYDRWRRDSRQVTWGMTYLPLDLPADSGWTRTVTGSPTESLASGLLSVSVSIVQAVAYSKVPGGTVAGGIIASWSVERTSGSFSRVRLRTANGSHGYQLTVTLDGTTLTATDGKSGTTLATATVSGEIAVIASITNGETSLWYQVLTDPLDAQREFIRLVGTVSLTDDAGATWSASLVEWGHPSGAASAASWRWFNWIDDESASYVGTGLGSAVIPRDLLGRRYAGIPVDLDGSTSISANGGPTYSGETWTIRTAYENGPDKIHPEISPSPQVGAKFDAADNQSLIWDLHTSVTGLEGKPLSVALIECNFPAAILYGWDGASWVNLGPCSFALTAGASWTRAGRIVVISSGGTALYVAENQLAGGTIDLGGGKVRKIAANGEGQIGLSTSVQAWIRLEGIDDTEGSSGTCSLYSPQGVFTIAQPASYSRIKLYIASCTTPSGYIELGKMLLGSLRILPRRPSSGRDVEYLPQYETDRPKGGVRSFFMAGRFIRRARLPFSDLLPSSQMYAATPAPGYAKLSTAGAPIASAHGAGLSLVGMIRALGGSPVVYVARMPQTSSNSTIISVLDPSLILYGRILDPVKLAVQRGNEGQDASFGLDGIVVEEEP